MSQLSNPHDKFFKATFSRPEIVTSFLEEYLPPAVVNALNLETLELQKDSFIAPDLQEYFSDLLYRTQAKDGETDVYIYLLLEHKSWVERLTPLQLLEYIVQIMKEAVKQGEKKLPPVIPLVVYHGRQEWRISQDFADLFEGPEALRPYWPAFHYELLDLVRYDDADIRGMALTQVGLLLLKYIYDPDLFEQVPSIFSLFKDLMKVQTAVEYLETALIYLSTTSERFTSSDMKKAIEATKSRQGDRLMPTLAEQWIEEGKEDGRIQGIRESILDLLLLRFDAAPPHIAEQISEIENLDLIKALNRQAATAESLSAFEAYLNSAVSNNP
jgi:predicted transposase/invertase (TIGR01784 family)